MTTVNRLVRGCEDYKERDTTKITMLADEWIHLFERFLKTIEGPQSRGTTKITKMTDEW